MKELLTREQAQNIRDRVVDKYRSKPAGIRKAIKEGTAEFFARILDDETEATLWKMFMTGNTEGVLGDADGMKLLSPVCWAAFKRACEYKHGLPKQMEKDATQKPIHVYHHVTGANDAFFKEQAKALGIKVIDALPEADLTEAEKSEV